MSSCLYLSSAYHQFPLICLSNINLNGIFNQIHCLVTFLSQCLFLMVQMETAATWTLFPFFFTAFLASTRRLCKAISKFSLCPTCPITPCPFQLEPLRSTCRCSSQSLQTELPLTSKCPLPPSLPYSCSFPLSDVLKLQLNLVPLPSTSEDSTWPTKT